jgi:mannose-6-phosphate isomerase-like protein (cupin superfamily)
MAKLTKVSLREKLDSFSDTWNPRVLAQVNEFALKIVKLDGAFIWHHHEEEDEIFFVVRGRIDMHYLDDGVERVESFGENELLRVPHGVEHKPVAAPGTELMLIERLETPNTGNVTDSDRLREPHPV